MSARDTALGPRTVVVGGGFAGATWFWGFVVVALLAVISAAMTTKRR